MAGASLLSALIVNVSIGIMKLIVGLLTGSAAMMAEAAHSFADTFNQLLLALGIRNSKKEPDLEHPFGYQKNQFFWSFVVAILIFGISGTYAVVEGISKITEGDKHEPTGFFWNIIVLVVAIFLEFYAFRMAYNEAKAYKEKMHTETIMEALEEMQDPVLLSLLVEDSLALIGLTVALIGTIITFYTHNPVVDGITSIVIGVILMVGGVALGRENKTYLIGKSVTARVQKLINTTIEKNENVILSNSMKTMKLGPKDTIVALDLTFVEGTDIAQEIDNIEKALIEVLPELKADKIFIEAQ